MPIASGADSGVGEEPKWVHDLSAGGEDDAEGPSPGGRHSNRAPGWPGLASFNAPPCTAAICAAGSRPNPAVPISLPAPAWFRSKIFLANSSGMPGPLSVTARQTSPPASLTSIRIVPPLGVCRSALSARLPSSSIGSSSSRPRARRPRGHGQFHAARFGQRLVDLPDLLDHGPQRKQRKPRLQHPASSRDSCSSCSTIRVRRSSSPSMNFQRLPILVRGARPAQSDFAQVAHRAAIGVRSWCAASPLNRSRRRSTRVAVER